MGGGSFLIAAVVGLVSVPAPFIREPPWRGEGWRLGQSKSANYFMPSIGQPRKKAANRMQRHTRRKSMDQTRTVVPAPVRQLPACS